MKKYPNQKSKILFAVLCLAVALAICYLIFRQPGDMHDEPEEPDTQQPEQQTQPVDPGPGGVYTDSADSADGKSQLLSATWEIPDFHEQLQGEVWQNVKTYYETLQQQKQAELAQLKEQAQQQYDNLAGFVPYSISETYEITRQDESVLSVLRVSEEYLGGATGQNVWRTDNFSMTDGTGLTLEQVLEPEATASDLLALVQEEIAQQRRDGEEFYEEAEVLAVEQFQPQQFYFTESGLVLYYPAYVLSPYTEGPQAFTLPYDDIKAYVRQEYRP